MSTKAKGGKKPRLSKGRIRALKFGCILLAILALWGWASEWYVHHPRAWLLEQYAAWPKFVTGPLYWFGNPLSNLTDAMDWTGHDAVYEYDTEAPKDEILFAGAPRRTGWPAPDDIRILSRGEFLIGWSDRLRHPVWCAYHVPKTAKFPALKRPGFIKDRAVPMAPAPAAYTKSGYDRGHMVPNYALVTRFGETEQKKTFMMSNIAPQAPALNRGVWRDVEHRIADLWSARYGEIWVIVGCISDPKNFNTIGGEAHIDIPTSYYQVIVAQEKMDIRILAVLFKQDVGWGAWAARHLLTVDELEELTGLDFNPDLPSFIQEPMEADLPTRLWPIRLRDIFKLIAIRFHGQI